MDYNLLINSLGGEEAYLQWASTSAAQTVLGTILAPTPQAGAFWRERPELDKGFEEAAIEAMERRSLDCVQRYFHNYAYPTTGSEPHMRLNGVGIIWMACYWLADNSLVIAPRTDLAASFKSPYVGRAVEGLYEYLTDCDARFHRPDIDAYGKFCSVVQSSGTGKSRTIVELMRSKVLGVYINLRPRQEKNSYPPRDDFPAQILTENLPIPAQDYSDRCVALFAAIFTVIRQLLCPLSDSETVSVERILALSSRMCDFESGGRNYFFKLVKAAYETMSKNVQAGSMGALSGGRGAGSKEDDVITQPQLRGEAIVREAYAELIRALHPFFETHPNEPKLVIAFDEAHVLGEPQGNFRPLNILCRVISSLSRLQQDVSNWVVFASTTPGVANVSVPKKIITPALQILLRGEYLFAPYSELGWDQLATPFLDANPRNVARLEHIMGFGNPERWKYIAPGLRNVNRLLDAAGAKLCNSTSFAPYDPPQALAVLAQRFCLDICFGHHMAAAFQREAISSHLRVCLDTTEDRLWQDTFYPSEPLLSCAAARLLHDKDHIGETGAKLRNSIHCLKLNMQNGLIEIGKRGELVSRVLYLVAKDLLVRNIGTQANPNTRLRTTFHDRWTDEELLDCKPVPVMDYLAYLFGSAVREEAGDVFENWYINFSHWIHMKHDIADNETDSPMHTWLARHWTRSCAIQCYHNQPIIDKLIPMYKFDSEVDATPCVSYILISDRARVQPTLHDLNSITPSNLNTANLGHPYIAILTDLHAPKESPSFNLTSEGENMALRIYAPGINSSTYPWLKNTSSSFAEDLREILDTTKNDVPGPTRVIMRNRFQYGQGRGNEYSEWDTQR